MAKVKKICRICGKEYTPCSYCENDQMAFHYRTICCSRDCAQKYLAKVLAAREDEKVSVQSSTDNSQITGAQVAEKPKRKYVRKTQTKNESECVEQIEKSEGTSD